MRAPLLLLAVLLSAPLAAAQKPVFEPLWTAEGSPAGLSSSTSLAASGFFVVATFADGTIKNYDRATGSLSWSVQTEAKRLAPPFFYANLIVVGGDDGGIRTLFDLTGEVRDTVHYDAAIHLKPVVGDNLRTAFLVADADGHVRQVSKADGSVEWEKKYPGAAVSMHMRTDDDIVLLTTREIMLLEAYTQNEKERRTIDGGVCMAATDREVFVFTDKATHRIRPEDYWDSFVLPLPAASCGVLDDRNVYVPTRNGTLGAFVQTQAAVRWETPVLGKDPHVIRLRPEELLLVSASGDPAAGTKASLHLIHPEDGRILASHTLPGTNVSAPVRSVMHFSGQWSGEGERIEDYVLVGLDGNVHAINLTLPDPNAKPTPASPLSTTPIATPASADAGDADAPGFAAPLAVLGILAAAAWRRRPRA